MSIQRLSNIRDLVHRDTCPHDWVGVEGATLCCKCGADLDKIMDEFREASDPEAGGVRVAVKCGMPDEVPRRSSLTPWLLLAAWIVGAAAGWMVMR
jgi:hypothetical protein